MILSHRGETEGSVKPACGLVFAGHQHAQRLRAVPQRPSLQDKLAAFDPQVHGGEVMPDGPQGVEFGAGAEGVK